MTESEIIAFLHCGKCLEEWKADPKLHKKISPRDFAKISVGWSPKGIQAWCNRHNCNIIHIDFDGSKHIADTSDKGDFS